MTYWPRFVNLFVSSGLHNEYHVHIDLHQIVGADPRVRLSIRPDAWVGCYNALIS